MYWCLGSAHAISNPVDVVVDTSRPMGVLLTSPQFTLSPSRQKNIYQHHNYQTPSQFLIITMIHIQSELSQLMSQADQDNLVIAKTEQLSELEEMICLVGSNGRYQIMSFILFSFMWFMTGWLLLGGSFFFDDNYTCFHQSDKQQCSKYVCSRPSHQRMALIKTHAASIAFQFPDNYLICDDLSYILAILQSTIFVGSLLGFFLIPYIADNWGRIIGMRISWAICTIGVVIIAIADSVNMIGLGYLLTGFGCNPAITLCYSFINEQCIGHPRQRYGAAIQIFFAIGECTIGLLFIFMTWREIIYLLLGLVLIENFLLMYLIQTPKFKSKQGKKSLLVVLNQIAVKNKKQPISYQTIEKLNLSDQTQNTRKSSLLDLFKYRSLLWISISSGVTFLGIQAIYYSTTFNLDSAGYTKLVNQEIIGISEAVGYIIGQIIIPKVPRKIISAAGMGISASMCVVLTLLTTFETQSNSSTMKLLQTGGLIINRLVLCCFWVIFYVYVAQLFPTTVRSLGYGLTSATGMIGSAVSPYIIYSSKLIGLNTWIVPGVIGYISLIFIFYLPETFKKPLKDEIEELENKSIMDSINN